MPSTDKLRHWIEQSLASGENLLATSNQGIVLLYQDDTVELIIKTAMGRGLLLMARRKTLVREYQAYQRMKGLTGVPECYGMIDDRYLLLERIRGCAYREAEWRDRDTWFSELLIILRSIHDRGVSHGDLKSKSNIMVTESEKPCVIDFGTSFVNKSGFHPINNWFFRVGKRLDINAWVKHKYHGFYRDASEQDMALLDYSWIEIIARKFSGRPMERVHRKKSDSEPAQERRPPSGGA